MQNKGKCDYYLKEYRYKPRRIFQLYSVVETCRFTICSVSEVRTQIEIKSNNGSWLSFE